MKKPISSPINRRQFIRGAGAGVALFNILPSSLMRGAERMTPGDKLNLAGIGIGSRGGADLAEVAGLGHNIVALCDVDENYAAKEFAKYPNAKRFVEAAKPIPTSFAREAFFAITAFQFTNAAGESRHGRFRIRPEAGTEYLTDEEAARKSANFLFDEIGPRLAQGPIRLGVFVQTAERGDDAADASVTWPDSRVEVPFGTLTLTARVDDQEPDRRRIIFDPVPRVDGIDPSGDPLTEVRSDIYLLSGRRRRSASEK